MTSLAAFTRTTVSLGPTAVLLLEWVAGVNVYSRKGTRMPSAILNSNGNSRFATLYILLICSDINPNPEPQWKCPRGVCHKPLKSNQKGIQCDYCDGWYHSKCCMNDLIYDAMANSCCLKICYDCGLPSFATSLFDYSGCMKTSNRFSPLAHMHSQAQNMDDSVSYQTSRGLPSSTSTPKKTSSLPSAQSAQKSRRLRLLNVNFRSVVNTIDQFHAMVDSVKPNIIVGTESWLRPDIMNSEIFPSNYTVYRRDKDTSGAVYLKQLLTKYCLHTNGIWKHHVKWLGQRSA